MKNLEQRKPLIKLLAVIFLAVLVCYLPEKLLFWKLCTEQDRDIPANAELLVSACKRPEVRGVPGGELLFVDELKTGKIYLLDLRTGEKRKVPNDPLLLSKGIFLSSELVWLEGSGGRPESAGYRPHFILDLTDGKRYELLDLTWLPLKDGKFNDEYYRYFQSAEKVFIHHSKNGLIALSSHFNEGSNRNVIFSQSSLGTSSDGNERGQLLEELMKKLDVDYEIVDFLLYYTDVTSPTNKYVADSEGLYLSETDPPILVRKGMFGYFKGWYYDDSGIIVQGGGYYLMTLPGISTIYYVPSPVIKLRLPIQ